ncbi:uncharacterized protein LOC126899296 isoform X2 [Daktulosphaira vitifoliae]|uniref:uncharacterized protein LOC126899296 isoform X2 n=1 Tax=Daktulosphaira vitifoliae TaxID=58002 RepID=UPI0021AA3D94|nr:uncharacterized protein LOC126899296 isoform X2 [Daktulosphaira vitifoliae]
MNINDNINFAFGLLDAVNSWLDDRLFSVERMEDIDCSEIETFISEQLHVKIGQLSKHGHRLCFFIFYVNSKLNHCAWIKNDVLLQECLSRYIHGRSISTEIFLKISKCLNLLPFYLLEIIMNTPYVFCRDLVDIAINELKNVEPVTHLISSEELIIALIKNVKRMPIQSDLFVPFTDHINKLLLVYNKETLPKNISKLDPEVNKKEIMRYTGHRVKSIFNILVNVIKYMNTQDNYTQYPLHKLKPLRDKCINKSTTNEMFQKFLDIIIHKCMDLCDFSISTWLSWYEIEVIEEDTNLQAIIGELCFDLCECINQGLVDHKELLNFGPVLHNIAVEKINYDDVDSNDIDGIIERVKTTKKHINGWLRKLIENKNVFTHKEAIETLYDSIDRIDYSCFKRVINQTMTYSKCGGTVSETIANVIFKGIGHLDNEDKMNILNHYLSNYSSNEFFISSDFNELLQFVLQNEKNKKADQSDLLTKTIWLVLQQPKKMLHIFLSQYIKTSDDLPIKSLHESKTILHGVFINIHKFLDVSYIYQEYQEWLSVENQLNDSEKALLYQWFLIGECNVLTQPDLEILDTLIFQLAKILDDARWNVETFSPCRVNLCEKIIATLQPLLHHASYLVKPIDLDSLRVKLAPFHLITRAHFLRLWTSDYITIDGMDEQFIMTIQSQSHISFSNLNAISSQKIKEEFIFSIATYLPRCTLHEMKSFVANYLSSAKLENILEATIFLLSCIVSAFMRIIVYLKTAIQNEPYNNECSWDYLENAVINFLEVLNTSRMSCVYEQNSNPTLIYHVVTKLIMITKQFENQRQLPLLVVIRRLIDQSLRRLDIELISKLLAQIATMKSSNSKVTLGDTVQELLEQLTLRTPNQSSQIEN